MSNCNQPANDDTHALTLTGIIAGVVAMAIVVVASNILVQYPMHVVVPLASDKMYDLSNLLTWGAFTYPVAFLVTDITNRYFGSRAARLIVWVGFVCAVIISIWLATPRIAIASGSAFLLAQMLDINVFNRLRRGKWWLAPFVSSLAGSILDTIVFFSVAFAPEFYFLGANSGFAIEQAGFLGLFEFTTARWISWAIGDFSVKMLVALTLLFPYRLLLHVLLGNRLQST